MKIQDLEDKNSFDLVKRSTDWALFRDKQSDDFVFADLETGDTITIQTDEFQEVFDLFAVACDIIAGEIEAESTIGNKP